MAATAKHDLRQNYPSNDPSAKVSGAKASSSSSSGDEDIAAIAKQISDHAEAIYQTWKSRGLAPTEILNCHSDATAADKFDSVLTPVGAPSPTPTGINKASNNHRRNNLKAQNHSASSPPQTAVELLAQAPTLDNNKLEKLVNNFVVEDKARLAAAASNSTLRQKSSSSSPSKTALRSSIQLALEKFETRGDNSGGVLPGGGPRPSSKLINPNQQQQQSRVEIEEETKKPSVQVFLDTIETTFPSDVTPPSRIVQVREKRPASVTSFVMKDRPTTATANLTTMTPATVTSGLTTWPLKNKINSNVKLNKRLTPSVSNAVAIGTKFENVKEQTTTTTPTKETPRIVNRSDNQRSAVDDSISKITDENCLADEVAREEERLINALMTGSVIPEEVSRGPPGAVPSSSSSSLIANADNGQSLIGNNLSKVRQKPAVKKEKPKVEPIKPIILSAGSLCQPIVPGSNQDSRLLTKEDLSTLSAVDYAKIRYKAAQQQTPNQSTVEKGPTNSLQRERIRKIVDGIRGSDAKNIGIEDSEEERDNPNHRQLHSTHHHSHHHHHHLHHHRHANRRNQNNKNNNNQSGNKNNNNNSNKKNNNEDNHADDEDEEELLLRDEETENEIGIPDRTVSAARIKFESTNRSNEDLDADHERLCRRDQVSSSDIKSVGGSSRWGPRVNSTPSRPRLEQLVPHPELTTQQRQHIRAAAATGTGSNPIRPFLTRGSVAERVLIFEKCPSELLLDKRGPRQPAIVTWRTGHEVLSKAQSYARERTQQPQKSLPPHTTLQRHVKANRNVLIPRFYFPGGKPVPTCQLDIILSRISAAFQSLPGHRAAKAQFHVVAKACDCPLYWKVPLFLASGGDKNGYVDQSAFLEFWKKWSGDHHDAASRFVAMMTQGLREFIVPEDLIPLVQDVVETHPGLTFLKEAKEFHSRYVHTVVARIFYSVNRSWSGKITVAELRRSNLLAVISILEHEEDINQVTAYFSYEHFYVIYCKFWELDLDHDLFIDSLDLTRHNDNALSTRMIDRIFSGAVTRGGVRTSGIGQSNRDNLHGGSKRRSSRGNGEENTDETVDDEIETEETLGDENESDKRRSERNSLKFEENKMSYTEFVWFLLSEEDKNHPTAIEYWFRCMDLDGDGYLSMYELEYFYEEQLHRMEAIGIETLPFEDCLCQMLDMIRPTIPGKISLSDLKRCKMTSIFFDTFFNLEKYLDHEQRDPFASARDHDANGHELSDWDRFAAEEYELLVAEEGGNEQKDQMLCDDEM